MGFLHNLSPFLYRRLGRPITCEINSGDVSTIRLRTKFDVASFGDTFGHPFYWQIFSWMTAPPELVVDCGANCGHFSLLADRCAGARFPGVLPHFVLIEPNPALGTILAANLRDGGLSGRSQVAQFLLGSGQGVGTLWVHPRNYLLSSLKQFPGSRPHQVPFASLATVVGDRKVGVMKVDIEGGEFDLIPDQLEFFRRVQILVMEAHASLDKCRPLIESLASVGLTLATEPIEHFGNQLLAFLCDPAAGG